jgi:uncharacterized membrane protein
MYDKTLVIEIFEQILNSVQIVLDRFEVVDSIEFFTDTPKELE